MGSQPTRFRMRMVARGLRTPPTTTRAVPTPDGLSYTNCPWFVSEVEFCKMEIRFIFFKEIVGLISLKTELKYQYPMHLRAREEKSTRRFFLPKVSLISVLQKFSDNSYDTLPLQGPGEEAACDQLDAAFVVEQVVGRQDAFAGLGVAFQGEGPPAFDGDLYLPVVHEQLIGLQ